MGYPHFLLVSISAIVRRYLHQPKSVSNEDVPNSVQKKIPDQERRAKWMEIDTLRMFLKVRERTIDTRFDFRQRSPFFTSGSPGRKAVIPR